MYELWKNIWLDYLRFEWVMNGLDWNPNITNYKPKVIYPKISPQFLENEAQDLPDPKAPSLAPAPPRWALGAWG